MRRRFSRGATLIELLLTVTLLSMVLIMGAAIVQRLHSAQRQRILRRIARQLAHDKLQVLIARPYAYLWTTSDDDAPGIGCLEGTAHDRNALHEPPETFTRTSMSFIRTTCIEGVSPNTEGQLVRTSSPVQGLKRMVVRVRWPEKDPRDFEQLEYLLADPFGPANPGRGEERIEGKVLCAGAGDPRPCRNVWFYLFKQGQILVDRAVSDGDGEFKFSNLAPGPYLIRAQLQPYEKVDPVELGVDSSPPESPSRTYAFLVTRAGATVKLQSNRENTLVTLQDGTPSRDVPDIVMREPVHRGLCGALVTEPITLEVPSGNYSIRCWKRERDGQIVTMVPPGGSHALLSPTEVYAFTCKF